MKSPSSKTRKTPSKITTRKEIRNWLDLPRDVMIFIFMKLGVLHVLFSAQMVCSSWWKLAKEPQLFRCIDMRNPKKVFGDLQCSKQYAQMVRVALNRSCSGELVEFSVAYFVTNKLMELVINKSKSLLTRLRLVSCSQVSDTSLIKVAKENPLLKELELCYCSYSPETIKKVGRSCHQLKYFRLNTQGLKRSISHTDDYSDEEDDFNEDRANKEAFAIANSMPQLRRLHLFGNWMTNNGLHAILDKCPHLEYLDLRQCFSLDLADDSLKKRVDRIRDLRLPKDSTHDYEFDASYYKV